MTPASTPHRRPRSDPVPGLPGSPIAGCHAATGNGDGGWPGLPARVPCGDEAACQARGGRPPAAGVGGGIGCAAVLSSACPAVRWKAVAGSCRCRVSDLPGGSCKSLSPGHAAARGRSRRPLRGGRAEGVRPSPRVARRPPGGGHRSTRGYIASPLRGGPREAAAGAVTWPWCSPRWPPSCPGACLSTLSVCALGGLCVEAVRAARRLPSPRPAVALGLPLRGCFRTDDHGLRASRGTRFGRTETGSETASKPAGVTGTPHAVAVLRYLVLRYRRETPSHFGKPQLIVCLRCAAHKIHLSERNFGASAEKT